MWVSVYQAANDKLEVKRRVHGFEEELNLIVVSLEWGRSMPSSRDLGALHAAQSRSGRCAFVAVERQEEEEEEDAQTG